MADSFVEIDIQPSNERILGVRTREVDMDVFVKGPPNPEWIVGELCWLHSADPWTIRPNFRARFRLMEVDYNLDTRSTHYVFRRAPLPTS